MCDIGRYLASPGNLRFGLEVIKCDKHASLLHRLITLIKCFVVKAPGTVFTILNFFVTYKLAQ
jgi:hypothetical protein